MYYSRSPLTEAVIDLRVRLPDYVTLDALAAIQKGHEEEYPTREEHILVQGQITAQAGVPPVIGERRLTGYKFISRDSRQIVQVRLDGFAFSRLAPYKNWQSFRDEARRWWHMYRSITRPEIILRVAVRYINRLDLPLSLRDLKDYLRTVPEVSPDLPQELSGYFMQLQIPQEDLSGMLTLNETIVPSPDPEVASILLDIDLFREANIPDTEEDLWEFFERLRTRKNEIFEACITDQMRELIR